MSASNEIDNHVDDVIFKSCDLQNPKSFFLFAGAGSGKTRSLVNALREIKKKFGLELRFNHQSVAVITYTNAASDEIKHRLEYDPLFYVSTIHSFIWDLIKPHQVDIKKWLKINLELEISKLEEMQKKGRADSKAAIDRIKSIASKTKRLESIDRVKSFNYSPSGLNKERDSLNHSEIINIGASFLNEKELMQKILCRKFPILLIDESQDTNKYLIDAFFEVQKKNSNSLSLGLFGDTMQRVYTDGKVDLGTNLPADWITPSKKMNHRCAKRIVKLINDIRASVDGQEQLPRVEQVEGIVRLFLVNSAVPDKDVVEREICSRMAAITNDKLWDGESNEVKVLTIEHHMAARRLGFLDMFEPLYQLDSLKTGLLDGSLPGLKFFTELIIPLVKSHDEGDSFGVANVIKKSSPLLSKNYLKEAKDQLQVLKDADIATKKLLSLWEEKSPRLIDIIQTVSKLRLFEIPESLQSIAGRTTEEQKTAASEDDNELEDDRDERIDAWDKALGADFNQILAYSNYISDKSRFGTHQGIKGLEFSRVLVILDDEEARGFLFSYEKLFGVKELSAADLKKEAGVENGIDRTRRLFYVTCSRAKENLAVVAYTRNIALAEQNAISLGWFKKDEIVTL